MTIIDGGNYTQLTNLNVTEILRVGGEIVTAGGGDVIGPSSSTIHALPMWDNTSGTLLADTGLLFDGNTGDLSFTLVGTEVGIDWDDDITMHVVPASNELATIASNGHGLHFRSWDNTDVSDSDEGFMLSLQSGVLNLEGTAYDGLGMATGEARIDIDVSVSSGPIRITDTEHEIGMVYVADYAANFTARSIVDKAYVDAAAGSSIDVSFVTGASQTVTITSAQIAVADSLYIIKDADGDASSDPVTIETENTELIDGSLDDAFIVADFGCLRLVSDGTNLFSW